MLGNGSQASPFQIVTASDFNSIRNNLTAHYILKNDIDLSPYSNFIPVGNSTSGQRFMGVLNGNGFIIKNLKISRNVAFTGLFGFIENATIKNLGVIDANVNSQSSNYSGILVGNISTSSIDQCYTTGILNGQYGQGGLVGWYSSGTISNSWSNASITSLGRIGGLVGNIVSTTGFITNSYTYGSVSASQLIGGLVGTFNTGVTATNVVDSYWNTDIYPTSPAGTGLTTSQFADSSNFSNWNTSIWGYGSYPYLKVFGEPALPSQQVTVTLNSHSDIANQLLVVSKRKVNVSVSYVSKVVSSSEITRKIISNVLSHVEQIVSNVNVLKNANVKNYEVTSYLDSFGSDVTRIVATQRIVQSHVNPIDSIIVIDIPIGIEKPIFANVYIVENPTNLQTLENQSNVDTIENKSLISNWDDQTNTHLQENATETSVI